MRILPRPATFESLSLQHGPRFKWRLLGVVGVGIVAGVLSTSSFNVAITALSRDFGIGQERAQWTMTGFMMAMTLSMLPTPWLLDRLGFRRLFLMAVMTLTLTSVAGSLASNFLGVVLIRILQGMAAGILQPLGTLLVMRLFPPSNQGRAVGILTLGLVLAPAVAPAFGGVLVDHFGWQAIFLLNLPFCVVAGVLGLYWLPLPQEIVRRRFDWLGVSLLSLATLALVEGVASLQHSGLMAWWTVFQFILALALIGAFVWHARRSPFPIINIELFGHRSFTMGSFVSFTYGFGLFGSTYLIPVFLQKALGYSATAAGMVLLPGGIALALTTPIAGRMADRYSPKYITMGGLILFGLSFLIFAVLGGHIDNQELFAATVTGRIGLGLILPALSLATLRHLDTQHLAQSSTVVSYMRQLGGVLGIAVIAVFVQWRESIYGSGSRGIFSAYSQGFTVLSAVVLLAVLAAASMKTD
jgi:EmrB/QacA subfamily drug resistance transporter